MAIRDWLCKTISLRSVALELEDEALTIWLTIRDGVLNIAIIVCVWYIVEVFQGPDFYYYNASVSSVLTRRAFFVTNDTHMEMESGKALGLLLPDYSHMSTFPMVWSWLHARILPIFAHPQSTILLSNRLLGKVRLRQLRVRNDTCELAGDFEGAFAKCLGVYSDENESKDTFGPGTGAAWMWSSARSLGGASYTGEVAIYGGGGYFLDVPLDLTKAKALLKDLEDNHWLDEATRAFFVDMNLYNADSNVFILVKLYIEMPPTGGLLPRRSVNSIKLMPDHTPMQAGVLTCLIMLLICALWTLLIQCAEVAFWGFYKYVGVLAHYLHLSWIVLAMGVSVFGIYNEFCVHATALQSLSSPEFTDLLSARYTYDAFRMSAVLLLALSWARLLFLSDYGRHSKLTYTLYQALPDAVSFSFMFVILMLSFAMVANLVFGSNLYDFRTFSNSLFVLLYVIPGYLDYKSLSVSSPILGPMFFVTFTFIVVFVLYNMFIVILNDRYFCVREEDPGGREMYEVGAFLVHCFKNACRRLRVRLPSRRPRPERVARLRALRTLLLKCKMPRKNVMDFIWRLSEGGRVDSVGRRHVTDLAEALRQQQAEEPASWEHYSKQLRRLREMENGIKVLDSVLEKLIPELR